jgi:hypothetical protein
MLSIVFDDEADTMFLDCLQHIIDRRYIVALVIGADGVATDARVLGTSYDGDGQLVIRYETVDEDGSAVGPRAELAYTVDSPDLSIHVY